MTDLDLYIVFSNPKPGREADAVAWYDEVHLPELLELDEVVSAQRFERTSSSGTHRFMAIYECASSGTETAQAIAAAMASGAKTVTDSLESEEMQRVIYSPATNRLTSLDRLD